MEVKIKSEISSISLQLIKEKLEEKFRKTSDIIPMDIKNSSMVLKGVDPTILSASVGAAAGLLGVLIKGLLDFLKEKTNQDVEVVGKSGVKIKVPRNISDDELNKIVKKIHELENDEIKFIIK